MELQANAEGQGGGEVEEDDDVFDIPEMDAPRCIKLTAHGNRWDALCQHLSREFGA